jgi:hypothetical protein
MPTTSTTKKPRFETEAEEAEWYHTKAGREYAKRMVEQASRKGKLVVDEKLTPREAADLAKKTGKSIVLRNGAAAKPTDPAVLQEIMNRVSAKQTLAISIRISHEDLNTAKRLAKEAGIGYQTLLKDIIHAGLGRA